MSLGDWLGLGQLVVAVLGFSFAIWQLKGTRQAVERTEDRLKVNDLLYELPQLHRLERDLDESVRRGDIDDTIRALNDWRAQASRVGAYIRRVPGSDDLVSELHSSIAHAGQAKNALVNGKTNALAVTTETRASIEKVCRDIPSVAAELRSRIGGEDLNAHA